MTISKKRVRDPIKHVRDLCKSAYVKSNECYICNTTCTLEFHHYNSMTLLLNKWVLDNDISITTDEEVLNIRGQFRSEHMVEIYDETVTLCKLCHSRLHKVYNKCPPLHTAQKQKRWVQKQRDKQLNNSEKA